MENISKIVVDKNEGKQVGYVLDVVLDFESKLKKGYCVVDEETENEFFLPYSEIISISDNFIIINSVSVFEMLTEKEESLIGKSVLDEKGFCFGKIEKLIFVGRRLSKIVTEKCEISSRNIKDVGKEIVFVGIRKNRNKKVRFNFANLSSDALVTIKEIKSQPVQLNPERVMLSSSYYVGKTVNNAIMGYNNELIIAKGEVVTRAIVEKAKLHNRLNQLFFALKR